MGGPQHVHAEFRPLLSAAIETAPVVNWFCDLYEASRALDKIDEYSALSQKTGLNPAHLNSLIQDAIVEWLLADAETLSSLSGKHTFVTEYIRAFGNAAFDEFFPELQGLFDGHPVERACFNSIERAKFINFLDSYNRDLPEQQQLSDLQVFYLRRLFIISMSSLELEEFSSHNDLSMFLGRIMLALSFTPFAITPEIYPYITNEEYRCIANLNGALTYTSVPVFNKVLNYLRAYRNNSDGVEKLANTINVQSAWGFIQNVCDRNGVGHLESDGQLNWVRDNYIRCADGPNELRDIILEFLSAPQFQNLTITYKEIPLEMIYGACVVKMSGGRS